MNIMKSLLLVALAVLPAAAEPSLKQMERSIVQVIRLVDGRVSTGTGFLIDGKHVVTNMHVACGVDEHGTVRSEPVPGASLFVLPPSTKALDISLEDYFMSHRKAAFLVPAASSADKDLAVLTVTTDGEDLGTPVTLAPEASKGDRIWVCGFPAAAKSDSSWFEAINTEGLISSDQGKGGQSGKTRFFGLSAAINPGNSGGPVFNEAGQVVAVVVQKSVAVDVEGLGRAIQVSELLPLLAENGLSFNLAKSTWNVPGTVAGTVLMTLGVAGLRGYRRRPRGLRLVCVEGPFAGNDVQLAANEALVIGRDSSQCQLVVPGHLAGVSKRHCLVRCERGSLTVEDCGSSNGTFVGAGQLVPGLARSLRPGDRFTLGERLLSFEVVG